jgi:hypothetical protein
MWKKYSEIKPGLNKIIIGIDEVNGDYCIGKYGESWFFGDIVNNYNVFCAFPNERIYKWMYVNDYVLNTLNNPEDNKQENEECTDCENKKRRILWSVCCENCLSDYIDYSKMRCSEHCGIK